MSWRKEEDVAGGSFAFSVRQDPEGGGQGEEEVAEVEDGEQEVRNRVLDTPRLNPGFLFLRPHSNSLYMLRLGLTLALLTLFLRQVQAVDKNTQLIFPLLPRCETFFTKDFFPVGLLFSGQIPLKRDY